MAWRQLGARLSCALVALLMVLAPSTAGAVYPDTDVGSLAENAHAYARGLVHGKTPGDAPVWDECRATAAARCVSTSVVADAYDSKSRVRMSACNVDYTSCNALTGYVTVRFDGNLTDMCGSRVCSHHVAQAVTCEFVGGVKTRCASWIAGSVRMGETWDESSVHVDGDGEVHVWWEKR